MNEIFHWGLSLRFVLSCASTRLSSIDFVYMSKKSCFILLTLKWTSKKKTITYNVRTATETQSVRTSERTGSSHDSPWGRSYDFFLSRVKSWEFNKLQKRFDAGKQGCVQQKVHDTRNHLNITAAKQWIVDHEVVSCLHKSLMQFPG